MRIQNKAFLELFTHIVKFEFKNIICNHGNQYLLITGDKSSIVNETLF